MAKKRRRKEVPQAEGPSLVEQVREAIRNSGESLHGLGARVGIGADRLSRFVRGERGLSLEAFDTLCRALGLRLTGGEGASEGTRPARKKGKAD